MITKITAENGHAYNQFLTSAYQYVEYLERLHAYQILSEMEWVKAYDYFNTKNFLTASNIKDAEITETLDEATLLLEDINADLSLGSHEVFDNLYKLYMESFETEEEAAAERENFIKKVYIIEPGHRDNVSAGEDRAFKNWDHFIHYEEKYAEYQKNTPKEIQAKRPIYILHDEDRLPGDSFVTLEQYFNYIETIKNSKRGARFILGLPLDEGLLSIDANTRVITIPPQFVSTVVQNDSLAETIVFTVDRFIENIDLANVNNVYVQWTAANTQGKVVTESATRIDLLKLRDIKDEKVKFGWPITKEITKVPGKITFSVVFFMTKEGGNAGPVFRLNTLPATFEVKPALQPEINTTFVTPEEDFFYSIRNNKFPGHGGAIPLSPSFAVDIDNDDPIEKLEVKNENDVLAFEVQAVAGDNGRVTYNWWVQPEGCSNNYNCLGGTQEYAPGDSICAEDYNWLTEAGKAYFTLNQTTKSYDYNKTFADNVPYRSFGTVSTAFKRLPETAELNAWRVQFVNNGEESSDEIIYVANDDRSFSRYCGSDAQKGKPLYEKYSIFKMPISGPIVGTYFATATSSKPGRHSETKSLIALVSEPAESTRCSVNGPITPVYKVNLNQTEFLAKEDNISSNESYTEAELKKLIDTIETEEQKQAVRDAFNIEVKNSETGEDELQNGVAVDVTYREFTFKPQLEQNSAEINYSWHQDTTNTDINDNSKNEQTKITNHNSKVITYKATTPGWYKQTVDATKNRKTNKITSNICRVTYYPRPVTFGITAETKNQSYYTKYDKSKNVYEFNIEKENEVVTLGVVPYIWIDESCGDTIPHHIYMNLTDSEKAKYTNQINNPLYSDSYTYKWYRKGINGQSNTLLTNTDSWLVEPPSDFNINTPKTIKVKSRLVNGELAEDVYICVVTNKIADRESEPYTITMTLE